MLPAHPTCTNPLPLPWLLATRRPPPQPPTPNPRLPLQFGAGAAMADQRALDILGEAYCKYLDPNTRVVNVDSREVLLNAGNVHCITQQQPAEVRGGAAGGGGGAHSRHKRVALG